MPTHLLCLNFFIVLSYFCFCLLPICGAHFLLSHLQGSHLFRILRHPIAKLGHRVAAGASLGSQGGRKDGARYMFFSVNPCDQVSIAPTLPLEAFQALEKSFWTASAFSRSARFGLVREDVCPPGQRGSLRWAALWSGLVCTFRVIWLWLKTKQEGLRRFGSMFPRTRVPFWNCGFLVATAIWSKDWFQVSFLIRTRNMEGVFSWFT